MPESFETPLDIARRACQHLGERMITSFSDTNAVASVEFNESYSRLRDFELERAIWAFSIRRAVLRPITGSTFLFTPTTYVGATTYPAGSILAYTPVAGSSVSFPTVARSRPIYWQTEASVTGEIPDVSFKWHKYANVITGDVYGSALTTGASATNTSYFSGELVIVPATYAGGTTYALNDIVAGPDGVYYVSLQAANTGHTPATNPTWWSTYATWIGTATNQWPNYVAGYAVYMSLVSGNVSAPPGASWQATNGTAANLQVFYPLGTGPAADSSTFNIMRVPYGFMRTAPRYVFDNSYPYLGADIAPSSDDWNIEGNFAVTRTNTLDLMRFVSNVVDVFDMHAMFCEMLAARMAYEGCERITGSLDKRKECLAAYEFFGNQARLVNAILDGEPRGPQSEYITCRI